MPRLETAALVFLLVLCSFTGCANREEDALLTLLPLNDDAAQRSVLIIGDSLTDFSNGFGLQNELGPDYVVHHRGIINKDFAFWTVRLEEALSVASDGPPAHVMVPLGTNDSFYLAEAGYVSAVHTFHDRLRESSQAQVYYFLLPGSLIETLQPAMALNNAALAANPPDDAILVDVESAFEEAPVPEALYSSADPLHPTESGYAIFAREMRGAIIANTEY